jgi:hypothetical protein
MDSTITKELWDLGHFARRVAAAQARGDPEEKFAVLVATGALNPVHRGHLHIMEQARR